MIMDKTKFHLGQEVMVGGERAVIDALTQSSVGLIVADGYMVVGWEALSHVGA